MNISDKKTIPVSSNPENPTFFSLAVRDRQAFRMLKNTPEKDHYFLIGKIMGKITKVQKESKNQIAFWFEMDGETHRAVLNILDNAVQMLN